MLKKTNEHSGRRDKTASRFILGADFTAKLNAVEGIGQSEASRAMFRQFDLDGLSPEERRQAIVSKHKSKS